MTTHELKRIILKIEWMYNITNLSIQLVINEINGLLARQVLRYYCSAVDGWGAALIWVSQVGG